MALDGVVHVTLWAESRLRGQLLSVRTFERFLISMMALGTHQELQTVKPKPLLYKVPSGCHLGPSLCSAQKQLSVHVGPLLSL